MISGLSSFSNSKLSSAAFLSATFIPCLSFIFPSSFRTSCGTSHSIFSVIILFAMLEKSILFFAHVIAKFVSSSIFIGGNKLRLCCWFLVFGFWFLGLRPFWEQFFY